MTLIIFYIIALLICRSNLKGKVHFSIFLFAILFTLRNDLVPDTISYKEIYSQNISEISSIEMGFKYLCYLSNNIFGLSFSQFLFFLTFILMELWYMVTKKMLPNYNYGLLFIGFMSFFGLYYNGIVIRSSIAIIIVYFGILYLLNGRFKSFLLFSILLVAAFFFHRTTAIFVVALLALKRYNKLVLYIMVALSLIIAITHPFSSIQNQVELILGFSDEFSKYNSYAMDETKNTGFDFIYTSYILICLLGIMCRDYIECKDGDKTIYNLFLNLYILGTLLLSIVFDFRAGGRLPMQWLYFEFIVVYFILFKNSKLPTIIKGGNIFVFVLYSLAKFVLLVHRTPLILNY